MKTKFNLSESALRHRSLVWYFMAIFAVMGVASYLNLGREEDPSFTIKTMLIQDQSFRIGPAAPITRLVFHGHLRRHGRGLLPESRAGRRSIIHDQDNADP